MAKKNGRRFVLLIDDPSNLDEESCLLVAQLVEHRAIDVIATGNYPGTISSLSELSERSARVDLAPFDLEKTEEVLTFALKQTMERHVSVQTQLASGGNPALIRDLIRHALKEGNLFCEAGVWRLAGPLTAGPAIRDRFAIQTSELSSQCRQALAIISSIGRTAVVDLHASGITVADLIKLERAELIRICPREWRASLRHPVHAELIQESMTTLEKAELIRHYRQLIGGRKIVHQDLTVLANLHIAEADWADVRLLHRAAQVARRTGDFPAVISYLRQIPNSDYTQSAYLMLADAYAQLGDHNSAYNTYDRAAAQVSSEDALASITIARAHTLWWSDEKPEAALATLESCQNSTLRTANSFRLARIIKLIKCSTGELPVHALANSPITPKSQSLCDYYEAALLALSGQPRTAIARIPAKRGETYVQNTRQDAVTYAWQTATLVLAHAESGHFDKACALGEEIVRALPWNVAPLPYLWLCFVIARAHYLAGRLRKARQYYVDSIGIARRRRHLGLLKLCLSGFAACTAQLGDLTSAARALNESRNLPSPMMFAGEELLGEAWVLACEGRLADSREVLEQASKRARGRGNFASEGLLLTEMIRVNGAGQAVGRLAELCVSSEGELMQLRRVLAQATREKDGDALWESAEALVAVSARLLAAEAYSTASTIFSRKGDQRRATAASRMADELVNETPGIHTPMLTVQKQTHSPLSAREMEVALMAARRTPSKEIAAHLCLSTRTVDNHLQRVYAKLGVASRSQLAERLLTVRA
ncbi:LuxR C-terminal-related transcriptional regulator [Streptomyces collinus]|uniref:LuxR C-terminal-related transcriptional regulator n=1 Tax=Streptomyces collinus TaxID=42684 RepID=UPI0036E36AA9